jgi:hypothetical protein
VLLAGSLALGILPNSVLALAVFAGAQVAFAALASNAPWNHGLMIALVNVAILLSIAHCLIRREGPEALVDTFAPAVRLSLVVLYLLTFFHKLNADFVNPDVSCAGVVLGWINRSYRILPLEEWAVVTGIWSTLFVELTVPLLLCFRRTVYLGVALGAAFHLFLSQYGSLHGFAAMIFALYFLFLPNAFTVAVAQRLSSLLGGVNSTALGWVGLPAIAVALLVAGKALGHFFGIRSYIYRGLVFWDLWLLGVIVLFGRELVRLWSMPAEFTFRQRWKPLWVIPLAVLLNGLSPYVGLKTETSWAMYSNLRTEVRPNHFIVPASAKVFGYQDDLVEIVDATLPRLERYVGSEVQLTFFELRRICSAATQDFTVSYRRNGERGTLARVDGIPSDPAACRAHPWLVGKLLHFRPVDTGVHATCRH